MLPQIEILNYEISRKGLKATYEIEGIQAHILANRSQLFEYCCLKNIFPDGNLRDQTFEFWDEWIGVEAGAMFDKSRAVTVDFEDMLNEQYFTEEVVLEIAENIERDRLNGDAKF